MFLVYIKLKIINIFKYINLFRLHSDTRNTSVQIRFSFTFLDTKILNPFRYLVNYLNTLNP